MSVDVQFDDEVRPRPAPLGSGAEWAFLASELEGDTPVSSPPESEYGGPTRVASPEPQIEAKKYSVDVEKADFDLSEEKAPEAFVNQLGTDNATKDVQEGGLEGWLTVMSTCFVLFCTFGLSNSFGVFQLEYQANLLHHYQPSTISWIGSVHLCLTFGLSLLSGVLFSRGWLRYQLAFGCSLWIVGIFALSMSRTYLQIFLSHAVCLGVAVGSCFGPCVSCTAQWFVQKRALVVGCSTAAAGLGAVIFPIFLSRLFPRLGFAATIRALAYLEIPLLLVANIFIRPRQVATPAQAPAGLVRFLTEPVYVLVCLGCFGSMIATFIPIFYSNSFARANGLQPLLQDYSLSIINGTAIIFRITSGLVADKFGTLNCSIPFTLLLSLLVFVMPTATTTGGFVIFLILFGVASGGFISLMPSCFLACASNPSEFGLRSGIGFACMGIAALIGSPIAGSLLSAGHGSYVGPCCFGGGAAMCGCLCLVWARVLLARKQERTA
ncbi:hypothetical protein OIV83_003551 [Microbotryomycetes sp. JL201]|nr:hypothetical protein OIV83_003551 [Microbotryomycetes sp. JL201]